MQALRPVLLDFFDRSPPDSMIGQTAAIHFALVPLLYDKTGIPFNLTIGGLGRAGVRDPRCDLCDEFRLGPEPRRMR
jgi:hypothetical protein